jgi:hypothetical protein
VARGYPLPSLSFRDEVYWALLVSAWQWILQNFLFLVLPQGLSMNSRRTFLASVAAMVPFLGSKAFAGKLTAPKTSTIIFTNNSGIAAALTIAPTINGTTTFYPTLSGSSITSGGGLLTATTLAVQTTTGPTLAVTYPAIPNTSITYYLNFDGTISTTKLPIPVTTST